MTAISLEDGSSPELGFDPVCGSRLPAFYRANPYEDGQRTFYFCSEACRDYFIHHGQIVRVPLASRSGPHREGTPGPIR